MQMPESVLSNKDNHSLKKLLKKDSLIDNFGLWIKETLLRKPNFILPLVSTNKGFFYFSQVHARLYFETNCDDENS